MTLTRSTCPYCGVGCGVLIESEGARIVGVRGDPAHPANFGRLCTKGSTLALTASDTIARLARLLVPMRRAARGADPAATTWDDAMSHAAAMLARIAREHGPDAIGFYVSGQLLTEDYYVFNKLAKGLVGTNNIDTNSRLCMSSAVAGYKQTLGADAPPACYEDIDHADCLFIAGSNAAWAHPVLFRRIEDAKRAKPHLKIVVVDPRRTETASSADLHLQIQPGTDVMLFHGLLHLMLWEGWTRPDWIAAHTSGFDALRTMVRDCTPDLVAQVCGVSKDHLLTAARWFATSGATLSLYCQGLNQSTSGTAKNAALIGLHLATAQIGRPGAGPFSLTGQPNAMGGREVGGLANLLSAHRDLANPAHRAEVAALWGVADVPSTPGRTAVELFEAAADGEVKALWIACTNPAQSMPDQATVRRALERCEFVVVQEAYARTETTPYADLLLPATTWGEKDGTVTNSERRISRVRPAVAAPGDARDDWRIAVDLARRLEPLLPLVSPIRGRGPGEEGHARQPTLFPYDSPESIWNEHRESTRGRDLDITGLSYALLEAGGPQQWPMPEGATHGKTRLYEDCRFPTDDGRARFAATPYRPVAEPRESRYPFSLTTGRLRDQWHGMTRTGTLGRLFGHVPEPCVQMHPQDLARRGLAPGDLAQVTGKRGSIVLPTQADEGLALNQAFIAMHWGGRYLSGVSSTGTRLAGVNALTTSAFCPASKQPELKHAAVKILKAELPWSLLAVAWLPPASAIVAREALADVHMGRYPFASCVPFADSQPLAQAGDQRTGVLFRAAAHESPPDDWLAEIEAQFGLAGTDTLRYADKKRGQRRAMKLVRHEPGGARLEAFLLAGDTAAEAWIRALLQDQQPAERYGRLLLSPGAKPPVTTAPRSPQVCTCFDIDEQAIDSHLRAHVDGSDDERLAGLQSALRCGTNCGSCIPALRQRMRRTVRIPIVAAA